MTCYLQLEDGTGSLLLEDGTGHLLLEVCNDDQQASNWRRVPDHDVERRNREYRAKLAQKQDEVIELKLEAQDLLLQEKELLLLRDKQSARQLKALQKEVIALDQQIKNQMAHILSMQEADTLYRQHRNQQALLIMQMAYPFLTIIGGGEQPH